MSHEHPLHLYVPYIISLRLVGLVFVVLLLLKLLILSIHTLVHHTLLPGKAWTHLLAEVLADLVEEVDRYVAPAG